MDRQAVVVGWVTGVVGLSRELKQQAEVADLSNGLELRALESSFSFHF